MNTETVTPSAPLTRKQQRAAAAAIKALRRAETNGDAAARAAAAAALAVADNAAAAIIAAKKAEEENAAKASAAAGKSPEVPEGMAPAEAAAPSFPGFAPRPATVEKRKVAWREQAPALFAMLAALPPEVASVKTQRQPGKFDPTARRARVNVPALDAYARQLESGDLREGLFYLVSTIRRVGEQNDIERRAVRSGTLTMFSGSTSTSASTKGYSPYDS